MDSYKSIRPSPCSAEIGTGAPNPSFQDSASASSPFLPSHLLAKSITGTPDFLKRPAK